jgi:hypothetical protein
MSPPLGPLEVAVALLLLTTVVVTSSAVVNRVRWRW